MRRTSGRRSTGWRPRRAAAEGAAGPAQASPAEGSLGTALGRLLAVGEAYPELRAQQRFSELVRELHDTEGRIAIARQVYNDTALTYNNRIQTAPTSFLGWAMRAAADGLLRARRRCMSKIRNAFWADRRGRHPRAVVRAGGDRVAGQRLPLPRLPLLRPAVGKSRRRGQARRVGARHRDDHVLVPRQLQRGVPRHPAGAGAVHQRRPRRGERHSLPAGRQHRARQLRLDQAASATSSCRIANGSSGTTRRSTSRAPSRCPTCCTAC